METRTHFNKLVINYLQVKNRFNMKKIKKVSIVLFGVLCFISLYSCSKNDTSEPNKISPADANALSAVLVIPGAQTVNSPTLPTSSAVVVAPTVSHIDTNVSYSAGSQIIIPSDIASQTQSNIKGVYIQVKGSSTYFDIPINSNATNALISLPVNLPSIVGAGNFTLILKFYDNAGNISLAYEVNITVTNPSSCGVTKVSGGEGITSALFNVPNTSGSIKISYDTYTVPDKIDVFQNGVWIGGTGNFTDRTTLRSALSCNLATVAAGYVGQNANFVFNYNPTLGQNIEVVMSGCENGGTAWEYTFLCPETTPANQGTFTFDNVMHAGQCVSTPTPSCTAGNSDVTINASTAGTGNAIVIYNMPSQSSGNYSFVQFTGTNNCDLYLLPNSINNDLIVPYTNTVGSVTKTGARSFTFTETFIDTNGTFHTVSGSGSY